MNQYQERNYAPKVRKIQKNDIRKYSNGSTVRKTRETIRSHCVQQSRESQEKEVEIQTYASDVLLTEEIVLQEPLLPKQIKVKKTRNRKTKR